MNVAADGVPLIMSRRTGIAVGVLVGIIAVSSIVQLVASFTANSALAAEVAAIRAANEALARTAANTCPDHATLLEEHCRHTSDEVRACYELVTAVERVVQLQTKAAIYAALKALEPQTGAVTVWAVDESTRAEDDSHLDLSTRETIAYFKNPAYGYSARAHRRANGCAGFDLSFWKALSVNDTVTSSLQLAYCTEGEVMDVRVCGAFNVMSFTEPA